MRGDDGGSCPSVDAAYNGDAIGWEPKLRHDEEQPAMVYGIESRFPVNVSGEEISVVAAGVFQQEGYVL